MNAKMAKTELSEYRKLNELIISKQIILANLKIRLVNLQATKSEKDVIIQKINRAEMEFKKRSTELERLVQKSQALRKTIDRKLGAMNELNSKILRLKYCNGYTLLLISTLLCYEYTWLCKLHARALEEYALLP